MDAERWRRISALYHDALERPEPERAAYLREVCAGDEELRLEIESLLGEPAGADNDLATGGAVVAALATDGLNAAASSGEPPRLLSPGARLGPYEIEELLGAGGMGQVFRARDTRLRRTVAIKVLPPDRMADPEHRRRFLQEARAASALNHPHIVTLYDIARDGDIDFLVMEYVSAKPLDAVIAGGKLPLDQTLACATQITQALAAAHAAGIVHRDIKPANILVTAERQVKVLDFGLAKLVEAGPGTPSRTTVTGPVTLAGVVMGTIAYMSPEQARGEETDARTDLFSFGAVLFEMSTGRRAFAKSFDWTPQSMQDVPPVLRPIVLKLLEPDRDLRYQTAVDVVADLKRLQRAQGDRAPSWRRWPALAAAAVLVSITGWTLFRNTSPSGPLTSSSDYTQLTDLAESAVAPSLSPDGRMVTFKVGEDFFLGSGQIYVKLLPNGESVQLTRGRQRKYGPVFTPDGSRVAYTQLETTRDGLSWDTFTVPVLGGEPTRLLPNASGLTFLSNGRVLFAEIRGGLHMGIVAATERRSEARDVYFPPHQLGMAHFAHASPNGQWILVVEMDQTHAFGLPCRLVPADGRSAGREVGPHGTCTSAAWSPDGQWMYFGASVGGRSHLWRQRFPDGTPEQITMGPTEEEGVTVAPDGRSLITALGIRRSSIWIHDATGERAIVAEGYARLPRLSQDGTRVFFVLRTAADSDTSELRALELPTRAVQTVVPGVSIVDYDISRDESEVAFTTHENGESQIWIAPLDRRSPPRRIASHADQVSFGPGDDLIFRSVQAPANAVVRISKDGARRQEIDGPAVHEKGEVSADGRWVIVYSPGSGATDPVATFAVPVDGGPALRICTPYCEAGWSADGQFFTVGVDLDLATGAPNRTLVVPLAEPSSIPELPPSGVHAIFKYAALAKQPGVRGLLHGGVSIGSDPTTYVFTKAEFHTNLFQIPLQR